MSKHNPATESLIRLLNELPDEALERLQYLQPEIGCFNSCGFCSQEAGTQVWQLDAPSLANLMVALGVVATMRGIKVSAGRTLHRPGVIFPYLDNDCLSYPHLDTYLKAAVEELGVKVRIASVGFSRHNSALVSMHKRIVAEHGDAFAGLRISFTPYTAGYAAVKGSKLSREEYEHDVAYTLKLYRPVLESLGFGRDTACVELRFHPNVQLGKVVDMNLGGHHVLSVGPHVLVSVTPDSVVSRPVTKIVEVAEGKACFSQEAVDYFLLTNDSLVYDVGIRSLAEQVLSGDSDIHQLLRRVPLRRFENSDGVYYAAAAGFDESDTFRALHIYPKTANRQESGYNDATRHFLNTLLAAKRRLGYARRANVPGATWTDVETVLNDLRVLADSLSESDMRAAFHVQRHILPLVQSYVRVLQLSGYDPTFFFNPKFTVDTGQIVNQGRAKKYFKGLVTRDDEPMTPNEARNFGDEKSVGTQRGRVWRIVPQPFPFSGRLNTVQSGGKAVINDLSAGTVVVHEVNDNTLRPVDAEGRPLRRFFIPGVRIQAMTRAESWFGHLMPGSVGP